jgi:methyl-accepting chemotaxis protein
MRCSLHASGATSDISNEIGSMHAVSANVVKSLKAIKEAVHSVEDSVTSVASAVEEQSATTREISTNMQTASMAIEDVNASLNDIVAAVEASEGFARQGLDLYRQISEQAA